MSALFLMYRMSENNEIIDGHHHHAISNHFTLENKNTTHTAGCINASSSDARILIVDDDPDITLSVFQYWFRRWRF